MAVDLVKNNDYEQEYETNNIHVSKIKLYKYNKFNKK